jgi:hypothetical protein
VTSSLRCGEPETQGPLQRSSGVDESGQELERILHIPRSRAAAIWRDDAIALRRLAGDGGVAPQACSFLAQRLAAAPPTTSARLSGVIEAERAFPPFKPPRRPRLTAAGSFPSSSGVVSRFVTSPVAISTMRFAHWFKSRAFGGLHHLSFQAAMLRFSAFVASASASLLVAKDTADLSLAWPE